MELKLEVVLSSSIKRKKPWPRFCWLGLEKESVFLLDDKRISEINMVSGHTKKKTPKLQPLLPRVVTMAASQNGVWLAGLLVSGEMFLWSRDKDFLKTVAAVPTEAQLVTAAQGSGVCLSLVVSGDGMRVLLLTVTGQVFLWECVDVRDLAGVRDGTARGRWAQIQHPGNTALPSPKDKEASQHSIFVRGEAVGDICLSAFVFTSDVELSVTFLKIQWEEGQRSSPVGYSVRWVTKTYPMSCLTPPCRPVRSRGSLVPAFSPDGLLLAVVLNQRDPRATQVLFVSTQNFVIVSSGLGGCGSKKLVIPSKYVRSYWVGSVSWAAGGLYLACVLKRGSFLMLARLGGLLSLSTSGCSVDFGPAHFLPLHPLVTYRPPVSVGGAGVDPLSSSSLSVRDVLRQRYSVTWHPRLPYLIVSDGYMATVLRVPEQPSPATLLRALLHDTSQGLESASRALERTQPHARAWLESISCLNPSSSLQELRARPTPVPTPTATATSTLPLFLQDQGDLGDTRELIQRVQALFEDDSDLEGPPAGSHVEDHGRLEFASMFDTLHALSDTLADLDPSSRPDPDASSADSERSPPALPPELRGVHGSLLTAWALGVSLGGVMEQRERLLKYTVRCAVRFAALLRLISIPSSHTGKRKNSTIPFSSRLLHLLRTLLSFLPWGAPHTGGRSCLGLVVELTQQLVGLLLSSPPDLSQTGQASSEPSSQTLSTALLLLQLTSHSMDHTYSLQQKCAHTDVYCVLFLQEEGRGPSQQDLPLPQWPSSRLRGAWRAVYRHTLQYWEELKYRRSGTGWEEEQGRVSVILSQIQTALQGMGERLEEGPTLLSYTGEQHFLFGSYSESAQTWRAELWAERERDGPRSAFLETRLLLSLLYGLLFQYRLKEAQGLGDHMARLLLHQAGPHGDDSAHNAEEALPGSWLPGEVHREAACAVIQTLGRFMASYFTNQPLLILPPHSVDVLPPLHLPHAPGVGRLVPLCQEGVAGAVRGQQLSEVWTVGYALDLLLQGGLLPEATWLAHRLGDWKTAVSLGLAYTTYSTEHCDFTGLRWRELHLPAALEPVSLFQGQLESLLGRKAGSEETQGDEKSYKSFTDCLEGEDVELLQGSVQEILKASVMAGVDVLSQPLGALLDSAKDLSSCLPALVPMGLYLPAPPLYCPQPAPNTQDPSGGFGQLLEGASRHRVSGVLQRVLLLLRSARCSRPAAQWYISHLRRSRHRLDKIRQKYSQQQCVTKAFPEALMKFVTRSGFFRLGPSGDRTMDSVTIQTIICFRELCGLCWMLNVRDQLSMSCRKYQAARNHGRDPQVPADDSEVTAACEEALHWACRFLPFSRFLNAEEILQDTLLSLVSELPPVPLVAESLVQAFPEEEESVRVPLREKYNSLLRRLRHCTVPASGQNGEKGDEDEGEEVMMILVQERLRQRRKDLKRLARHLAPLELYLWEREEEQDRGGGGQGAVALLERFSLGASLSNSTLTDCGRPLVYSDGDTAENSVALSPDLHSRPPHSISKRVRVQDRADKPGSQVEVVEGGSTQEEDQSCTGPAQDPAVGEDSTSLTLPVVGTWEFELEDAEYLRFLELFLSYVLEKDGPDPDTGCDPPLLKGFCSQLRERELHSLTFDVLTTLRRRQRDGRQATRRQGGSDAPVFRAGHCYKPVLVTTPLFLHSEPPTPRASIPVSVLSLPGLRTGRQQGLFGFSLQARSASPAPEPAPQRSCLGSKSSPGQSSVPWEQPSEGWAFGPLCSVEAVELQQELEPKLEAQFPGLGRLLEWMVRWADKRVLLGQPSRMKEREAGGGEVAGGGVVIRVKASAPAVLTALSMLEHRYTAALLGMDHYSANLQVPERQWTVAPVLQPEVGWKLERESSVDTGYPASAGTPITLPDQDPQHCELSYGSQTEGVERVTSQETSQLSDPMGVNLNPESGVADFPDNKCDLSAEKGEDSNADEALRSSASLAILNISVQIKSLRPTLSPPGQALTLADLRCSEREEDIVSSQEEEAENLLSHGSLRRPSDITEEVTRNMYMSPNKNTLTLSEGSGSDGPPNASFQPLPGAGPQAGAQAADSAPNGGLPQESTNPTPAPASAPNQTLPAQTDPVRQLLQDELFRLVQLQQINFMSLMQVVGASFVNLPVLQNNTLPAQSNVPYPHPNTPLSHPNTLLPHLNLTPSQNNMSPMPQTQSSVQAPLASEPLSGGHRPTDQPPIHEMQPLAVHPEPLRDIQGQTRTLISSSHGLQTTVDPTCSAPLLLPFGGSSQVTAPYSSGLKLLQLHPPLLSLQRHGKTAPVREAWGPPSERRPSTAVPPHLNPSQYDPAALRRAEERSREAERESTAPPSHLNLTQYSHYPSNQAPRNTLPPLQNPETRVERSRGAEPRHLPPTLPSHRPPPVHGLPLLRFHPDPRPPTTFALIPLPHSSRPLTVTPAAMGHNPRLQLLQRDPDPPRMMLPEATPPARVPHLIPLGELMGWAAGRQRGAEARLQLLRVDAQAQNPTPATPSTSINSSRRQKRRVERLRREGEKAEVTFRPEDSIILPLECNEDEPAEPVLGEGYVFPLGTFDSVLTGQGLVDKALSTAAELHAFASTHKRPPESHDACTNTDPASPHSDTGISAQPTVTSAASGPAALPPELFLNLRFPRDPPVHDTETSGEKQERNTGRQFINVIDLEDGALLQELPSCPRPAVRDHDVTPSQPSPPTSAQLHLLAASVTNSAPSELTADTSTEDDQPQAQPSGFSVASLPPAHPEPSGDPVTRSLLQERRAPGRCLETHRGAPSRAPVIQVAARLSEMDAQLAALQNIADHMEREFANTRLLVRTIETLGPAMAPERVEGRTPVNKTVTLAVSPEGWRSRLSVHHDPELAELRQEEEEQEEGPDSVIVSSAPWGVKQPSSLSPRAHAVQSTSTLHQPTPTGLWLSPVRPEPEQRVWDMGQDLTDTMDGAPGTWAEETLGLSGLSDVADILTELVRGGGISPTALGLSHTQAARLNSRLDQQQSGRAGQRGMRAEEERRELRVWMRRKQREKLVEYRRQREEKRERERKPFSAPVTLKPTSKDININKKIKEEKDKTVLLEHHNQRARDACSLITDLLTTPLTLPTNANRTLNLPSTSSRPSSTRPLTAQTVGSTRSSPRGRSLSVGGRRRTSTKPQTGRARSLSSPGVTPRSERRPASSGGQETLTSRLGLHRPASFLPGDRLSHVTRRGMITDLRGRTGTGPMTPSQQEWRREVIQSSSGWRGGGAREQRETEEREEEVVSPWNPPPEICRLLGLENSEGQGGVVARAGGAGLDRLDTLSESTGSILSKLDWAAIESIVASEGAI
ncbi:ciliogenesis and planar polarity effector 1 isoform X3 [Oncorhynchus tshawytscha]|uniref:ciliogenesis and planar polarity effector 1 isoform X3 n=1 Tax=Oncorhynchus tshawytscha TaxID=74940 RepID=UPI000D0A12CF|nr:ciliogenesis and planar polarity effector 1 isoform X3 [Oncorhynchus tshawytscha]